MNQTILNRLRQAVKRGLDEKASQIIELHGAYLSRKDIRSLITYMDKIKMYSIGVIRYVYYVSPHRHDFDPSAEYSKVFDRIDYNRLLHRTEERYPEIFELLIKDNRFDASKDRPSGPYNYKNERTLRLLLENHPYTFDSSMVFIVACNRGFTNLVRELLDRPDVDPALANNEAIASACLYGHTDTIKMLLVDPRINPADQNNGAINDACRSNNINIVRLLLADERVDPNDPVNRCRPIYNTNNIEIIRLLMSDDRVDPSADNNKAIRNAVKYGPHRSSRVKYLLTDDRVFQPAVRKGLDRAIIEARWQGLTGIAELMIIAIQNFEKKC